MLNTLRIDELRAIIRSNQVSFPGQVPTFERHDRPDLQWKVVQLYFVLGWSCEAIARRYGLIHQRVRQILKTWKRRAVEMGFIQYIPPAEVILRTPTTQTQPAAERKLAFLPPPAVPPNLPARYYGS
jgi:hypothetical protein